MIFDRSLLELGALTVVITILYMVYAVLGLDSYEVDRYGSMFSDTALDYMFALPPVLLIVATAWIAPKMEVLGKSVISGLFLGGLSFSISMAAITGEIGVAFIAPILFVIYGVLTSIVLATSILIGIFVGKCIRWISSKINIAV